MKRTFKQIFLITLAFNALLFTNAQNSIILNKSNISKSTETSQLNLGFCSETTYSSLGYASSTVKAGALFPETMMKKYVGNQIVKLQIAIANSTITNGQVFLSYNTAGTPFYTQNVTFTTGTWNVIELTTPYTIEDKEIFIGYSVVTGSTNYYPVAIDEGPAVTGYGDWFSPSATTGWISLAASGYSYNVSLKAIVEGNTLSTYDLAFQQMVLPEYVKSEGKTVITGKVKNLGTENINSFKIAYQFSNNDPDTVEIKNLNIASGGIVQFISDSISVPSEGTYTLQASIVSVNGQTDNDPTDNTLSKSLQVYGTAYPRKVIFEHFTTTNCINCPAADANIEQALANRDDIIHVQQHAGYGKDIYTTTENTAYLWFFGSGGASGSYYAPAFMLDRTNLYDYNATSSTIGSPVFLSGSVNEITKLFDLRSNTPAFISVDVNSEYNTTSKVLKVTVSGEKNQFFTSDRTPRMNVFLTEDSLFSSQANSSGTIANYRHDDVFREILTGLWGDPVSFTGNTYSVTYEYELPTEWNADKMHVIGFLADYLRTDQNSCKIFNAASVPLTQHIVSGVNQVLNNGALSIFTEGKTIIVKGDFDAIEVYDLYGRKIIVTNNSTKNILLPDSGMYIVKAIVGSSTLTNKVIVK